MRLFPTLAAAAGLTLADLPPAAGAQEGCQAQLGALDALLAERYPGLFPTAGKPAAAASAEAGGALSGDPPKATETATAADVPTSVMPGAGPEIKLAEEGGGAGGQARTTSARPLSQQEVDRVVTLRTLATERLSAGREDDCGTAVREARGIIVGG